MLRRKIALVGCLASLALVVAPAGAAQELPPTCLQPAFGLLHAELAQAGVVGSEHVPGLHHLGFAPCVRVR